MDGTDGGSGRSAVKVDAEFVRVIKSKDRPPDIVKKHFCKQKHLSCFLSFRRLFQKEAKLLHA